MSPERKIRHDRQLNQIVDLLRDIFPEIKRTGYLVQLGSIVFEPIIKRGVDSDKSMIGINVQSNYDWTPVRKVMLKADGSIDANKIKSTVKDQQEIIKQVFDKQKKSEGSVMKLSKALILLCEESNNTAINGLYVVPFYKVNSHLSLLVSYLNFINADAALIKEVSSFNDSIDLDQGMPKLSEEELIKILMPMQPMWTNVVEFLKTNHDYLKGAVRLGRRKIEPDKIVAGVSAEIKKLMMELKKQGFDINKMRTYQ